MPQDPLDPVDPEAEAIDLLRELIRIDTSNDGSGEGPGEALAAEYVASCLTEVGYDPERFETTSGRRQGVALRIPGENADRPALLLHGHLDVVPAVGADWSVPPFAAEIVDDMVWGRGAVDMKDTDAIILAIVRDWARRRLRPPRDVIVVFTPDEEAGGEHGAHWIVENRPDLLEGATEAVGEVGGFSVTLPDARRLYLIQTAEKGIAWMRLTARGTAGHGSMVNPDNAVTEIARAIARIGEHDFPVSIGPTADALLRELAEAFGVPYDGRDPVPVLKSVGPLARFLGSAVCDTANPSMLQAGYKANVIPGTAEATVDGRFLPGHEDDFLARIDRLLGPGVDREFIHHDVALEVPFEGALVEAMTAAIQAEDPGSRTAPYLMSGGTDAKAFSRLGIRGYGFAPLRLPPDLDFAALFHGVDERVPIDSVRFGVRTLGRFLLTS